MPGCVYIGVVMTTRSKLEDHDIQIMVKEIGSKYKFLFVLTFYLFVSCKTQVISC